jgi:Uma2 family endonuclease
MNHSLTLAHLGAIGPGCKANLISGSASDALSPLPAKMQEYSEQPGFQLGLLVDRRDRAVYVYRQDVAVLYLTGVSEVDCGPELAGFILKLDQIW